MTHSWDPYYQRYSDWDESHSFNIRVKLEYEQELIELGYTKSEELNQFGLYPKKEYEKNSLDKGTYLRNNEDIYLAFEVPYDWSIDSDWEDKALELLGIKDEWVVDSIVEDN